MIPLKLSLQNFLCYRDNVPPLDVSGIHVACLCGPNGHGKSALLDAITWALWGVTARGRSADDLLHFGEQEMMVELDFMARDAHYRAARRHSRAGQKGRGRGGTNLQLQVSTGNGFQTITGNSLRETQAAIVKLLGMDYDTFVNSAFLIQGRADEFTNKTPGDRKEVLGLILGLGRYDDLLEASRAKAQERRDAVNRVEGNIQLIESELSTAGDPQAELDQVAQELETVGLRLAARRGDLDAARLLLQDLEQKARQVSTQEAGLPQLETEIHRLQEDVRQREARIAEFDKLVEGAPAIESGFSGYRQARDSYEGMNAAPAQFDALTQKATALGQAIAQARARLEEQVSGLQQRLERELQPRAAAEAQVQARLEQARQSVAQATEEERGVTEERHRLQGLAADEGQLTALLGPLKTEGEELRAKLDLLQLSSAEAVCPLCASPLGEDGCDRLSKSYQTMIEAKRQQYRKDQTALQDVQRLKQALERELPGKERALKDRQQESQRLVTTLERDAREARRAATDATEVQALIDATNLQLKNESFAAEEQQSLRQVTAQIAGLAYSPQVHHDLYQRMQQLQPFEREQERLREAVQLLPAEREARDRAAETIATRKTERVDLVERIRSLNIETAELPALGRAAAEAQREVGELEGRQQLMLARRGELEARVRRLQEIKRQSAQMSGDLSGLREDHGLYQELAQAFGRQGVQALLIETVLPRIEEEANQLLARMTDGRMTVKLETQRELRSRRGEFAETLEIRISDELGPRSYEMFSGGEAFRINLALRIALSKVLAHRSGAPLPTLFIDEGFGTQDTAGRERILDVIRAIEPDFQRIIVITHLDELKEAFPVRIEVEKRDGASTCWIS